MTKIVVISDTHISNPSQKLPDRLIEELKTADMCIHAGDFVKKCAVAEIESYTKLVGVKGNMDDSDVDFPQKKVLTVDGVKIGVIHGQGAPAALPAYIEQQFQKEKGLGIIIFGHSHQPMNEKREGTIYCNPGSPTDAMYADVNSFGIIEVDRGGVVSCRIIKM